MRKNLKFLLALVAAFIFFTLTGFILGRNLPEIGDLPTKILTYPETRRKAEIAKRNLEKFEAVKKEVLPEEGFTLPISWENIGPRLIAIGVIDLQKFKDIAPMSEEESKILSEGGSSTPIVINNQNSDFVVNVLWGFGLAQKSIVYEEGPLGTQYKDDLGSFASTGGWILAKEDAVNYLGKFDLVPLTDEQQIRVGEIAKNIYRPCCGNSAWFPDCNHGMAALAAIELMVSGGFTDDEIYKEILKLNSFWFPHTYLTSAIFFSNEGTSWRDVDAKRVLGTEFSSYQGAAEIAKKVGPLPEQQTGGSCGA